MMRAVSSRVSIAATIAAPRAAATRGHGRGTDRLLIGVCTSSTACPSSSVSDPGAPSINAGKTSGKSATTVISNV
jgi:hypothetical protein